MRVAQHGELCTSNFQLKLGLKLLLLHPSKGYDHIGCSNHKILTIFIIIQKSRI